MYCNRDNTVTDKRMITYQVKPLGKIKYGEWDELITTSAVVVIKNHGQANRNGSGSRVQRNRKGNLTSIVLKPKDNVCAETFVPSGTKKYKL